MGDLPLRLQIKLSKRHRDLLQEAMQLMEISKREALNRAIEGLNKIAHMQRKKEKEKSHP